MNARHHLRARTWRHAIAAVLTLMLSIVVAPAAVAKHVEFSDDSGQPSVVEDWPQSKLDVLVGQEAGMAIDDSAEPAGSGEPAIGSTADDSSRPWLLAVSAAIAVAAAGLVLAVIRSRRPPAAAQVERDREAASV